MSHEINNLANAYCALQSVVESDYRAKGESVALTVCTDSVLEEESVILPGKERRFMLHRIYKRPEVANKEMGNCGNINKGNGRSYVLAS
jgi:predicted transcriptional regulator